MYHLLSSKVGMSAVDAADPKVALQTLALIEESMKRNAAMRSRHLIETPRLVETVPDAFGFVSLTFNADTEDN